MYIFSLAVITFGIWSLNLVQLEKISYEDCQTKFSKDEFIFGGKGYVIMSKNDFLSQQNNVVKFSFKTYSSEGLLLLIGTSRKNFLSLELQDGKVIWKLQDESELITITSRQRYDDGKWHVLSVTWTQWNGTVEVDGSTETATWSTKPFTSININGADFISFGGLKRIHKMSGLTENRFKGSIKGIQLGNTRRTLSEYTEKKDARQRCRTRRMKRDAETTSQSKDETFWISYNGSTNVELKWEPKTEACYDKFLVKLPDVNQSKNHSETTDHVIEIKDLVPNTKYEFELHSVWNNQTTLLKSITATTVSDEQLSLIVDSVTKSSVSVKWTTSRNVSSTIGFSINGSETIGFDCNATISEKSRTFSNLTPGTVYELKLTECLQNGTNNSVIRTVSTVPDRLLFDAHPSTDTIFVNWTSSLQVDIMYRRPYDESCKRIIVHNQSHSVSIKELQSACTYELNVFSEVDHRRSPASSLANITLEPYVLNEINCSSGQEEGKIECKWNPKKPSQCIYYSLYVLETTEQLRDALQMYNTSEVMKVFDHLNAGQNYTITIQNNITNGSNLTTFAIAKPGIDKDFYGNTSATNDSITMNFYQDNTRKLDSYTVKLLKNNDSYTLSKENKTVQIMNLTAGTCYDMVAVATSSNEKSNSLSGHVCTVPNPASFINCTHTTNISLTVKVGTPTMGDVDKYEINITNSTGVIVKSDSINAVVRKKDIGSLTPYTIYNVTVKSQQENRNSTITFTTCKTLEGLPGIVDELNSTNVGTYWVNLRWKQPKEKNGVIIGYLIKWKIHDRDYEHTLSMVNGDVITYELKDKHFESGKSYIVMVSAKTSAGVGPHVAHPFKLEEGVNVFLVVCLVLLPILIIILIVLLVFYYLRKSPERLASMHRFSSRLVRPALELTQKYSQPSVTSKPIKLSQFLEHVIELEKDSGLKFTEEYEELKFVGRHQSRDEAELQCNRVKNRFTNILPYDISRVKILPMEDEEGSDYINASWIPGFHSKREFIASQGPLSSTMNDFWRMVWENNCKAIVMLTLCIEKGHIKCEQYWPNDSEPVFYGDLKVEILNETKSDEFNSHELRISLGSQTQNLTHYHYISWPDMYVPERNSLLEFVHIVRDSINKSSNKGPIIVHCSAGVGRTGTFIALDTLLHQVQENYDLDVYGIVFQMRMNRVLMVQTEAQYIFIYECVKQVLEESTTGQNKSGAVSENGDKQCINGNEESTKEEKEDNKAAAETDQEPNNKEISKKTEDEGIER